MHRQDQYLLVAIVESSQDSIVTIDLSRVITSWNKGAEHLYGYSAEEAIGQPLEMVMLPVDIQGLIHKVNDIIHEVTVPIYETVRLHKNGRQSDLEILLSPVRNHSGKVIGISTVARDITARKMQNQHKDEFISVASHELKTPVASIKAYAEVVLDHLESSGDHVAASIVRKLDVQVDRLIDLIDTLLDTTKLAAGELLLQLQPVDLNVLIEEQVEALTLIINKQKITFHAGEIKPLLADKRLIGQVITNLISNASKFSPDGSEIILSSSETEKGVEITVRDFGIGIRAEMRDNIFKRYFRVADPLVSRTSGIGLGLYITAGIVYQHRGTISVQSEEGRGSTFTFTLPYDEHIRID
jgi:two-component system sensor histidine kinase VicK